MAKKTWINIGGVWKEAISIWENVGGVWKKDIIPKGNIGGLWKNFKDYVTGQPTIVTDGLIGYWNSKQGVNGTTWNNIAPETSGLFNATLVGTTVQTSGMTFDSINDYIDFNVPSTTGAPTPYTWELRVIGENLDETPSIIADGIGQFTAYLSSGGEYLKVLVGDSYSQLLIPMELRTPERYLAFSYNPVDGLGKYYINGVSIGTTSFPVNQTFSRDGIFRLGGSYEATAQYWHFRGVLDNFRLYDRVLGDLEIVNNFNVGTAVGLPNPPIVQDSFNRANSTTSLGTTETGQVWQSYGTNNVWGIQNNQVYPVTPKWDFPVYIDAGVSDDVAMQVTISTVHSQQQIFWRIVDANYNYFALQGNNVSQVTNNNWDNKGTISPPLVNGDIFRVELSGNKHVIKVNGNERVAFSDESHMNATKFGFSGHPTGTLLRFDDFLIEPYISPESVIPDVPATNIVEDFLDDTYNLTFTQDATYPWSRFDTASPDGNLGYIKSSNQGISNTYSNITFDILVPSGTVKSWIEVDYVVDSEVNYDYLYIYIDGIEKLKVSGIDAGTFNFDLIAGTHKLKITYYKDNGANIGTDSAYISGIRLLHLVVLAKDTFNRSDSLTLGTTETGQVWQSYGNNNVWGIQNNQAYPVTADWDEPVYVDVGESKNVAMQVTISTVHSQQQIFWRIVDANYNYFCIQGDGVYQVTNNIWESKGEISPPLVDGDVFRVELIEQRHSIKVNGVEKISFSDVSHLNATKFGFSGHPTGNLLKFDDFSIQTILPPESVIPDVPATNIVEDFLDNAYNFTFTQDGAYPWSRFDTASPDGNLGYIKSSNQGIPSSSTYIFFDILVPANTIRSWIEVDYVVDSEVNYDYLYIYIDGIEKLKVSGINQIGMFTGDLTAGTHKLKITYFKDGNADSGTDSVYISGIRLFHQTQTVTPLVSDSFNRANSTTSLGTTETGQTWQSYGSGVWGIQNNQAYPVTLNWNFPNYVETTVSDNYDFTVRMAVVDISNQIMWRIVSSLNFFTISGTDVRRVIDNVWVTVGTIPTLVNGDLIRVVVRGSTHRIFVNGILKSTFTDTAHLIGTKVGFSSNSLSSRFDDFKFEIM